MNHLTSLFFIAASSLLCSCNTTNSHSTEHDKKLIKDISAARAKAFNEGNAAGIAIHFTDDALLMAPGKPAAKGIKAVELYYQSIFTSNNTTLESHYEEL